MSPEPTVTPPAMTPARPLPRLAGVARRVPVTAAAGGAAAAVALGWAAPASLSRIGPVVLLAGLLVGLPHGALDVERAGRGRPAWARALIGLGYLAATAATFALWWHWHTAVLVALLVLAAAHFGDADVAVLGWSGPALAWGPAGRAAGRVAFGGLAVALPFAVWPDATRPLLRVLCGPGGDDIVLRLARLALPAVLVVAAGVAVGAARSGDRWTPVALAALLALFAGAPPLFAFGVYFAGWHALRQTCQQLAAEPVDPARPAGFTPWAARAAVPSVAALLAVAVLVVAGGMQLSASALALLLAVTVPHSVVDGLAAGAARRRAAPLLP